MMFYAELRIQTEDTSRLPFWASKIFAMSPGHLIAFKTHFAAMAVLDGVRIAGFIIVMRLLVRRPSAHIVLAIVVIGFLGFDWFLNFFGESMWLALAYGITFGAATVLLYTRVGILAVMVSIFVVMTGGVVTIDFDTWFAPYAMAELAILLALAGYGFWVSLAGQALFKDALLTEKPART